MSADYSVVGLGTWIELKKIKPPEFMQSKVSIKLGTRPLSCIISLEIQYPILPKWNLTAKLI